MCLADRMMFAIGLLAYGTRDVDCEKYLTDGMIFAIGLLVYGTRDVD